MTKSGYALLYFKVSRFNVVLLVQSPYIAFGWQGHRCYPLAELVLTGPTASQWFQETVTRVQRQNIIITHHTPQHDYRAQSC